MLLLLSIEVSSWPSSNIVIISCLRQVYTHTLKRILSHLLNSFPSFNGQISLSLNERKQYTETRKKVCFLQLN